jgi:hypothetical protein
LADDAVVAAFDPVRALAAAEEARREEESLPWTRRTHVGFQEFAVRPGMGVAEALFWLRVAADLEKGGGPGYEWRFRVDKALALYPEQMPPREELEARVVAAMQHGGEAAALWLLPLIGLRQVAEWFVSGRLDELAKRGGNWNFFFLDRAENRLPGLVRRSEWRAALAALDEHLDVDEWFSVCDGHSGKESRVVKRPWTLAVALGHTDALRRLVESWPDDVWQSAEWPLDSGIRLVGGVRDPAFSLRHFARLRLLPECAAEAGVWLAHTGDAMLGPVLALVRRAANQDETREIVGALGAVEGDLASLALIELALRRGGRRKNLPRRRSRLVGLDRARRRKGSRPSGRERMGGGAWSAFAGDLRETLAAGRHARRRGGGLSARSLERIQSRGG